jgi:outer membrane usher protein
MKAAARCLALGCAVAIGHAAPAVAQTGSSGGVVIPIPPSAPRVDTAPLLTPAPSVPPGLKRRVEIIVPFKERSFYIGDVTVGVSPDGSVDLPLERVKTLLQPVASQALLDALAKQAGGRARITLEDLNALGLNARYDPSLLEVSIVLPLEDRQRRDLQLYTLDRTAQGRFVPPATFSAWLTWRTSLDYVNVGATKGQEFPAPAFDLSTGMRFGPVALEAGGNAYTDSSLPHALRRDYTRLVYDQPEDARRWTLGDLDPGVVGFQTSPDMVGIQLLQSYNVLQPGRDIRPRGLTSFSLRQPGQVDVLINGQLVRKLNLDVGSYDLRDFPFTAGQNSVQLVVEDPTGRRELYSYQQFYNLDLLAPGLTEFQLSAGIPAPFVDGEPRYDTTRFLFTGFARHGFTDSLTLGINGQADSDGGMGGLESVWASPFGILGVQAAGSDIGGKGGWAGLVNFQYQTNPLPGEHRWSLGLNLDTRSAWFSALTDKPNFNQIATDLTAYFSRELSPTTTLNLDVGYLWKRGGARDTGRARVAVYQRVGSSSSLGVELRWDQNLAGRRDVGVYISFDTRFGFDQFARASFDSIDNRARLSYQRTPSDPYDDWSITADLERVPGDTAFNGNIYRQWNRLETSLNHSATFDEDGDKLTSERTSLRLAGSIAYADGAVAVGRPIYDSFAIVEPHDSLEGHAVRVDPEGDNERARTDALGPALVPDLAAYARRTLVVDVDKLPPGYNLDSGAFDVYPPYHGGYRLVVGSDYAYSVIGMLVDRDGEPVTLLAGRAYEGGDPKGRSVELFTDRKGRFAATGLKPGKWRIVLGDGEYTYDLEVQAKPVLQMLTAPLKSVKVEP